MNKRLKSKDGYPSLKFGRLIPILLKKRKCKKKNRNTPIKCMNIIKDIKKYFTLKKMEVKVL